MLLEGGAPALDILGDLGAQLATVLETHLLGVGSGGFPAGGSARGGLLHHLVDLLERQALGLGNEEVSVDKGAGAESAPDPEDVGAEVALVGADHVGGDDGNDTKKKVRLCTEDCFVEVENLRVPEPVGGGRESNTARADGKREDLANDDPGTRTPGAGKEEDEDGNEGDLSVDRTGVLGNLVTGSVGSEVVEADSHTNDGDEELANQHAKRTPDEERTTTKLLNSVEGDGGRADVDEGEDQGDQEGVVDGASGLQERSGVVEDEVDTSPLLHHLERSTKNGLAQVGVGLENGAAEAVGPALVPATSRNNGALVLLVGNNLRKLGLDVLAVGGLATQSGEGVASLLDLATLDEVSGGVGKEHQTATKDETPGKLNGNGDAVLASVATVSDCVVDAGGDEETQSDGKLVASNEGTADFLWANLRHV